MSTPSRTLEQRATVKPRRVLACVLCQERKIKFPERELFERVRQYERLLRQNNIEFEALHTPAAEHVSFERGRNIWHAMSQRTLDPQGYDENSVSDDDDDDGDFLRNDDDVPRIIGAADNITNISPTLEALLFSIYVRENGKVRSERQKKPPSRWFIV
ncbi:hypothetical protein DL766_005863 [Monosporascus sp. MC13-8B]|uniref:Uncharacterized protein n=1 Tax=Monosporascus cannonballus TaxID=155416 RepID=A0ABY0GXY7_9PEZI|nr:hypothetical protein DL762_009242 [Monosporascus cannonballus]RYO79109.1 hypothetical protein DL763_009415 [Monosporascus cannonballus]RYP28473.1 hypothetical protein DL766_005863 [Monosporascus sp. MC13-8B]